MEKNRIGNIDKPNDTQNKISTSPELYTEDELSGSSYEFNTAKETQESIHTAMKNSAYTRLIWATGRTFHKHTFWEICFVIKGKGIHHFPDRTEEMFPGTVWILRPDDVHYVETLGKTTSPATSTYAHRDIYVKDDKMQRILNSFENGLYNKVLTAERPLFAILPVIYTKQIESMLNYYSMHEKEFEMMHSVIVSHIICCILEQNRYSKQDFPDWFNTLLLNLDREDFMIQNMEKIIASTGYTQSYVCRQFRKYMNMTLVKYIRQTKCHYSLSLLTDSSIQIIDIAYRLHFSDESAYINIFKQIYNITPGQWRKELLEHTKQKGE